MNAFERYNQAAPPIEPCCSNCGVTGELLYQLPSGALACDQCMAQSLPPAPVPAEWIQMSLFSEVA
jgi:hypothetical protein